MHGGRPSTTIVGGTTTTYSSQTGPIPGYDRTGGVKQWDISGLPAGKCPIWSKWRYLAFISPATILTNFQAGAGPAGVRAPSLTMGE
ncbi:hypothetical protein GCM10027199_76790 [Amycolatopsis magusensis]